ncbi:flagellar biosynthesis protein FlhA [Pseudoalteromonas sp. SMS1]|uniref:flagellar biosynthesis protein FlhA n=1 Tax=Pseudoalteromonas sp. SMS1 TaxID=2908894 RepID=UPI001F3A55A3|nr:flagellar biosynthesis protein FlhA [Pseudoalteromonas sp. SMS1]MCF2860213.1 flagellar biosynthesis protein FlhA [Pseudoalteromonas sp. SMS1]
MTPMLKNLATHKDLLLVVAIIGILTMLFVPVPPVILDIMLITNFSLALLILLLTFYTDKPLSFSTLPSLLLIATLFRLGLNISATRLILEGGDAGEVIHAIGSFVVGGNYVIGLVVFFILIVVQYVVVTNGAQRVAEVAARFTLDSMPGKQMSIDADLNMGLIDDQEAKTRRKNIEKEANFYGAMDGASKFVKGDAIAGIIIILIDIIGGLSIGIVQLGMSWDQALETYTLLTVGDGIVTQIPSLIIATATGIIITRAATDAHLSDELGKQITSSPKTLFIVAGTLGAAVFLPGAPSLPIAMLAMLFFTLGVFVSRSAKKRSAQDESGSEQEQGTSSGEQTESKSDDFGELLKVFPLELAVSHALADKIEQSGDLLSTRFQAFRKQQAQSLGVILPQYKVVKEPAFSEHEYEIRVFSSRVGKGTVQYGLHMAIDPKGELSAVQGDVTKEPTYGLPAAWIPEEQVPNAKQAGYTVVDSETTLLTHITEVVKSHSWELLTRSETEALVSRIETTHSSLLDELIPNILSYTDIQKVFQMLLKEKVSIKNIELILECLVDQGKVSKEVSFLAEKVREKLKTSIVQPLSDENDTLHVVTLDPLLEQQIISGAQHEGERVSLSLDGATTELLITQLGGLCEKAITNRISPVLVCHSPIRLGLKQLLERVLPQLSVVAVSEIPVNISVQTLGVVSNKGLTNQGGGVSNGSN